jgi:hypothetical protein
VDEPFALQPVCAAQTNTARANSCCTLLLFLLSPPGLGCFSSLLSAFFVS